MHIYKNLALIVAVVASLGRAFASEITTAALPQSTQSIESTTFVVFDTETTGFSPKNDRVIEVGVVKIRNGKVLDTKSWFINPKRDIPAYAQNVHHISADMVKDSPSFSEIYPAFKEYIQGCVLVAHNARFDVSMVRAELQRAGLDLPLNPVIDTLKLCRRWYPGAKSYKLDALAEYLEVAGKEFHEAESDSLYDARILFKGLAQKPDVDTLGKLYADAGGPIQF